MTAVALLAKAPRPGWVKTRLAADIGTDEAAALYRQVGRRVVEQVGSGYPLTVWYDPPDALDEMRSWLGEREYLPQSAGDLGARMARAFGAHFSRGDAPVVMIGADAPGVTADTVAKAIAALRSVDAVFGPAFDGGYYLIALHHALPALFTGVPWGTGEVLSRTQAIARRAGVHVALLEPLRDLDTGEDVEALGLETS